MQLRSTTLLISIALVIAASAGDARAYPQFQLSTGNGSCSLCHISPAGGGLLNQYGRSEAGDTISQFGGDGSFLYGAYEEPRWLKLGLDMRAAALAKKQVSDPEYFLFPMQGDTYAWLRRKAWSFYATIGPRAQVRDAQSFAARMGSREHWLMWRPKTRGWYARAGRFFAPFGLRSQDHTLYVRRYLGFHSLEETYNVSVGRTSGDTEFHLTAFSRIPDILLGNGPRRRGIAGYWETRPGDDDDTVLAVQARASLGSVDREYLGGVLGKYYIDSNNVLFMTELNLAYQDFVFGAAGRPQLAAYASANYWPLTGLMLGAAIERYDEDLSVRATSRNGAQLSLQYFPLAHWELMLLGKIETQGDYDPNSLAMLQVHYYL